jgi:hypothetical protein
MVHNSLVRIICALVLSLSKMSFGIANIRSYENETAGSVIPAILKDYF